jgi:hypothetical protein
MDTAKKITQLERLLNQATGVTVRDSDDPTFKTWKNTVERTLIRVFGPESPEVEQFKNLRFFYHASFMMLGSDYSSEHRECFDRDFDVLRASIKNYIEELETDVEDKVQPVVGEATCRVFISHSSCDVFFVEELVDLLELIGLSKESIFCTSLAGYGIDLGENFLDAIRDELRNDTMVLFVLTQNFFSSPACLCEMGAVWVQTKDHIPIIVPPFDFSDIKGVIPLTEGFRLNDALKLNLFKAKIETIFGLQAAMPQSSWERKRDRALGRINDKIAALAESARGV